jgi:hypothetical protein
MNRLPRSAYMPPTSAVVVILVIRTSSVSVLNLHVATASKRPIGGGVACSHNVLMHCGPLYTNKGMATLLTIIRRNKLESGEHTQGYSCLFQRTLEVPAELKRKLTIVRSSPVIKK